MKIGFKAGRVGLKCLQAAFPDGHHHGRQAAGADAAGAAARLGAASAYYNAMMRTTCVATRLEAGHADNALPQLARAIVNCRLLPDESPKDVQDALVRVLADPAITVTPTNDPRPSPPSPLRPAIVQAVDMLPQGKRIFDVALTAKNDLKPKRINIAGSEIVCLEGDARLFNNPADNKLYHELSTISKPVHVRLIPYYAWDNRGASEMSVWMPVVR